MMCVHILSGWGKPNQITRMSVVSEVRNTRGRYYAGVMSSAKGNKMG